MSKFSKDGMPFLLGLLCFVLIVIAFFFAFSMITGIVALLNVGKAITFLFLCSLSFSLPCLRSFRFWPS